MKKLNRVIGYRPVNVVEKVKKDTHPLAKKSEAENPSVLEVKTDEAAINILEVISDDLKKGEKVVKWINEHPEFKWGVMCKKIGLDKGNFQRTLKSNAPKIKIEFVYKIEDFLKEYGYVR